MILRKIIKIAATRCHILKLKCTKFDFGWGSAPDPAGGAYSGPPGSLAGFKGPTSKGWEGMRREGRGGQRKGAGRERGREGMEREKGREGIGEEEGREEWGSPTHYFQLKSCTGAGMGGRGGKRKGEGEGGGESGKGMGWSPKGRPGSASGLKWVNKKVVLTFSD